MFRSIRFSPAICAHGGNRAVTRKTKILCFRRSERKGAFLSASIFVADHLRVAAKKAGVRIEDGQRFGLHNLRHSLSNWLVNKAKVEPKTVQGILRHSEKKTTLDLYSQDGDETRAAQGEYLMDLGVETQLVQ
jgi:integrase